MFQSPSLISDAVRRLALSATDRLTKSYDLRKRESRDENNILRIMTNLLTFSQQRGVHRDSDAKPLPVGDILKSYALLAGPRRSTVFLTQTTNLVGADRMVAEEYVFSMRDGGLRKVCEVNAGVARKCGRYDHERVFETLRPLLPTKEQIEDPQWAFDSLAVKVIKRLFVLFILQHPCLPMIDVFLYTDIRTSPKQRTFKCLPCFPTFSSRPDPNTLRKRPWQNSWRYAKLRQSSSAQTTSALPRSKPPGRPHPLHGRDNTTSLPP
jgi:hypothetical protein